MTKRSRMIWFAVFIVCVVLTAFVSRIHVFRNKPTLELLQHRSADFNAHVRAQEFGDMWDMSADRLRVGSGGKEGFVTRNEEFFKDKVIEVAEPFATKRINAALGISTFQLTIKTPKEKSASVCAGVVWVWQGSNWYFYQIFICQNEKEVIDFMLQLPDIKNAPK